MKWITLTKLNGQKRAVNLNHYAFGQEVRKQEGMAQVTVTEFYGPGKTFGFACQEKLADVIKAWNDANPNPEPVMAPLAAAEIPADETAPPPAPPEMDG